jgi:serine/threonine-protein kinase RsbW
MNSAVACDRLVIANKPDELRRMSQWLRTAATVLDMPEDVILKLDLCANEAVTNIINHAYLDERRHSISLDLSDTINGVQLVIRDDGKPFNPLEQPENDPPRTLDAAAIGGLGVRLIRRLMTRCDYQREFGTNVLFLETLRDQPVGNA